MCKYCQKDEEKDIYPESFLHLEKPNIYGKAVFELDIDPNLKELLLSLEYDGGYGDTTNWQTIGTEKINYCPMCGRKL